MSTTPHSPAAGYLSRDGHELFYTVQGPGDGIPLLFIHGWTCDSTDWSFQVPFLLSKFPSFRVITMDLRGHGRSRVSSSLSQPSFSQQQQQQQQQIQRTDLATVTFAADAAALLEHFVVQTQKHADEASAGAIVVGHSLGGVVASELAHSRPSLVRGLVLLDPSYLAPPVAFTGFLEALRGPDRLSAIATFFEAVYSPDTPEFIKTWHLLRAWGVEPFVAVDALQAMVEYIGASSVGLIRRIKVPGMPRLVVMSVPAFAEPEKEAGLNKEIEQLELIEAGHWMMKTRPGELNDILAAWLARYVFPEGGLGIIGNTE
ncbi:non-heme chloroperoxidase [Microdochium nivale]|nr:non-heme chloroperoxidase [Microdochium nivale]